MQEVAELKEEDATTSQGGATPQGPTYNSDPSRTLSELCKSGIVLVPLVLMMTNNTTCI